MTAVKWFGAGALAVLIAGAVFLMARQSRGYPAEVYSWRVTGTIINSASGSTTVLPAESYDEWFDPKAMVLRTDFLSGGGNVQRYIVTHDRLYTQGSAGANESTIHASDFYDIALNWEGSESGGFAGIGAALLKQVFGPVTHGVVDGQPALTFATIEAPPDVRARFVTIDARSHILLQSRSEMFAGMSIVYHFSRLRAFVPNTLPGDFFAPGRDSAWNTVLHWLGAHLGPHR
jgi:hypothetical protein